MTVRTDDREAFARSLGYASAAECDEKHDPYHRVVARLLRVFGGQSPTLHWVASGYQDEARAHRTRHDDAVGAEEDIVLDLQRWVQTGEYGPAMRILWLLGWSEYEVRKALEHAG